MFVFNAEFLFSERANCNSATKCGREMHQYVETVPTTLNNVILLIEWLT